ncbi:hypothetical protein GCM10009678_13620 [Actinomadura kijaniata]|uniref:Uncharacterized protein n=1 Tax=Actinomadura namibiensis TaxID=182080 RepID=A0A7W3LQP2_ACTNM|nr:hypothetical protein [Actinomadura namibiensis]MBA8952533.1 hypothetical protein [Actinomadura namibiensis]
MGAAETPANAGDQKEPGKWAMACGCLVMLLGVGLIGGLVWAVVSFLRWDPPVPYSEAATQKVVQPSPKCYTITVPPLPKEKRLDRRAKLEYDARRDAVGMTCDTDVKVACPDDCVVTYKGKQATIAVLNQGCTSWGTIRSCKYRLEPRAYFVTTRHLHNAFWGRTDRERREGHHVRCDTIPGDAEVIPPTPKETGGEGVKLRYRCHTRNPGSITYSYAVWTKDGSTFTFEEIDD